MCQLVVKPNLCLCAVGISCVPQELNIQSWAVGCRCNCFMSLRCNSASTVQQCNLDRNMLHCKLRSILHSGFIPPILVLQWVWHTCYGLTDVRARAGNASRRPWLLRLIEMDWNGLNLDCNCPLTISPSGKFHYVTVMILLPLRLGLFNWEWLELRLLTLRPHWWHCIWEDSSWHGALTLEIF